MTNKDLLGAGAPIDDCWNRIGIRGDQSCALLQRYIHCRNCPVHAQAAADILDRIEVSPSWRQAEMQESDADRANVRDGVIDKVDCADPVAEKEASSPGLEAFLLFRVAEEWFALPTRFISQVAHAATIHSLPRVRSKHVLGLTNVRGQLTVCASLSRLLDLTENAPLKASTDANAAGSAKTSGRLRDGAGIGIGIGMGAVQAVSRFIVARDMASTAGRERRGEEITVFPVDEVYGVERFARAAHRPVPATLAHATAAHTRSLLGWKGRTIGVLDGASLFETLRRSLG